MVGGPECATFLQELHGIPQLITSRARMFMEIPMTKAGHGPSTLRMQSRGTSSFCSPQVIVSNGSLLPRTQSLANRIQLQNVKFWQARKTNKLTRCSGLTERIFRKIPGFRSTITMCQLIQTEVFFMVETIMRIRTHFTHQICNRAAELMCTFGPRPLRAQIIATPLHPPQTEV